MKVKLDLHYTDPRLVSMYDTDNPHGADTDFYIQLAEDLQAETILDLGCGTGLLTKALAAKGYTITGIDPSTEMIHHGRQKEHGDLVEWIVGDASHLGTPNADLVLMTSNVAQVFLEDDIWLDTLHSIHAALKSGGYVAFESRNPIARAHTTWTREATHEITDSPYGPLECWLDVIDVSNGKVHMQGHNIFKDTGERLVIDSTLRFRTKEEIVESLTTVGFSIEHVYGDWASKPMKTDSPIMVFIAKRTS